jgi:hypothetical protein
MGEGPLARSTDLIVEELGDEVLIFDTEANRGHSLSAAAAEVWRSCDGETSAEELGANLGLDSDTVARALDELNGCDLLEQPPTLAPVRAGSTRRELTINFAKVGAAAAAAPLIVSVAAPTPAMAVSLQTCAALTASGDCGTNPGGCKSITGCCCCNPAIGSTGCPNNNAPGTGGPHGPGTKYCSNSVASCNTLCQPPGAQTFQCN